MTTKVITKIGVIDRVKKASTRAEVYEVFNAVDSYRFASQKTINRVNRIGKAKLESFK